LFTIVFHSFFFLFEHWLSAALPLECTAASLIRIFVLSLSLWLGVGGCQLAARASFWARNLPRDCPSLQSREGSSLFPQLVLVLSQQLRCQEPNNQPEAREEKREKRVSAERQQTTNQEPQDKKKEKSRESK
jgi:hypothetical protein